MSDEPGSKLLALRQDNALPNLIFSPDAKLNAILPGLFDDTITLFVQLAEDTVTTWAGA